MTGLRYLTSQPWRTRWIPALLSINSILSFPKIKVYNSLDVPRLDSSVSLVPMRNVLIGFALSPEISQCVNLTVNEFIVVSDYKDTLTTAFHGLKRIWEFLDNRGYTGRPIEIPTSF